MLDKLLIEGSTVSIDAMGTQVEIARSILDKKAHYSLAVKENQGALLAEMKDVMCYNTPFSQCSETEKEHAWVETRECSVYTASDMEDKEVMARWPGLKTLVCVSTKTIHVSEDGREETQTRYYISDEDFPLAGYYDGLARGHWSVENALHWHLDVTFKEDDWRARKKNAAQNLSLLRKLALQVVKRTSDKLSARKRLRCASWNPE